MLDIDQKKKFETWYAEEKLFRDIQDCLYWSWLSLKVASEGSEAEAFDSVLTSKLPNNLQKHRTKRKVLEISLLTIFMGVGLK